MTEAANADQVAYWNAANGESWVAMQARMDAQLDPLGRAAIAALAPKPGEAILDVGCGCGHTTLQLAEAVGAGGRVTGVDISRTMLAVARSRPAPRGAAPVAFEEADAQTHAFAPASLDAVFSRFGVMFFADPPAAFANLRRALKPGGRLAFVCWAPPSENPMISAPMDAARPHFPSQPPPDPTAPGPFAFADPARVRSILEAAGFDAIAVTRHDAPISPGGPEDALELTRHIGPQAGLMRDNPDAREAALVAIRAALEARLQDGRVVFPSVTWIVTAPLVCNRRAVAGGCGLPVSAAHTPSLTVASP